MLSKSILAGENSARLVLGIGVANLSKQILDSQSQATHARDIQPPYQINKWMNNKSVGHYDSVTSPVWLNWLQHGCGTCLQVPGSSPGSGDIWEDMV